MPAADPRIAALAAAGDYGVDIGTSPSRSPAELRAQLTQIRALRAGHPIVDAAAGFAPGVGVAQGVDDTAAGHYIQGPLEMLPGAGAAIKGLGAAKAMVLGLRGIRNLHGAETAAELATLQRTYAKAKNAGDMGEQMGAVKALRDKGAWLDRDGQVRMELSDHAAKFDPDALDLLDKGYGQSTLEMLDHPDLFKAYPELADLSVLPHIGEGQGAYISGKTAHMTLKGGLSPARGISTENVALHELQHAAQDLEIRKPGFVGTNAGAAGGFPSYLKDRGEMEARITALRQYLNPAQRRAWPFKSQMAAEESRLMRDPNSFGETDAAAFAEKFK